MILKRIHTRFAVLSAIYTLLLLSSCTVQKRLHRPGYFVEWHHRYETKVAEAEDSGRNSNEQVDPQEQEQTLITTKPEQTSVIPAVESENSVAAELITGDEPLHDEVEKQQISDGTSYLPSEGSKDHPKEEKMWRRKTDPYVIIGFSLTAAGLLMFVTPWLTILGMVTLLLALVLTIIGYLRVRERPEKRIMKFLSVTSLLMIGIVGLYLLMYMIWAAVLF